MHKVTAFYRIAIWSIESVIPSCARAKYLHRV